jgi:hypothetical protein
MSIAKDEHMVILNKLDCSFTGRDRFERGSYLSFFLRGGFITGATDIITIEMTHLGCLYIYPNTIHDRPFGIGPCIIEYQLSIDIIDSREPEISHRFIRQRGHIEGDRYIEHLMSQINTQSVGSLKGVDIERCSGHGVIGIIIDIDGSQRSVLSG